MKKRGVAQKSDREKMKAGAKTVFGTPARRVKNKEVIQTLSKASVLVR